MSEASVSIRLNPFKGSDGPDGQLVPWNHHARLLSQRPSFTLDPLFHAGCYYVQDSSAMYVGHIFRKIIDSMGFAKGGLKVLDLCAAPGGKTTDLACSLRERLGDDFLLVSNEVMKARAAVLSDNVALWGDPNVAVCSCDPAAFAQLEGFFDVVVADVPCSGEGMFRKDPRAAQEWSPEVVELCCARQKRILADMWASLKEGGVLIYSTCTYEPCENDDNLLWAAQNLGGEIIAPQDEFSAHGVELTEHGYLLKAGVVPGEGQWVGALVKTATQREKKHCSIETLRPIRHGIEKGTYKGKDFIPNADYALSIDFDRNAYPLVDVDLPTALKFLHRDSFPIPGAERGYNVICYQGHPLGFVKNIGQRCNNLLPKGRRILMNV